MIERIDGLNSIDDKLRLVIVKLSMLLLNLLALTIDKLMFSLKYPRKILIGISLFHLINYFLESISLKLEYELLKIPRLDE